MRGVGVFCRPPFIDSFWLFPVFARTALGPGTASRHGRKATSPLTARSCASRTGAADRAGDEPSTAERYDSCYKPTVRTPRPGTTRSLCLRVARRRRRKNTARANGMRDTTTSGSQTSPLRKLRPAARAARTRGLGAGGIVRPGRGEPQPSGVPTSGWACTDGVSLSAHRLTVPEAITRIRRCGNL